MCECNCRCSRPQLTVGMTLYGFCNGKFGRDSYGEKIVLAIGPDWVLLSEMMWIGKDYDERTRWLHTYSGDPNDLMQYTTE